MSRKVEHPQTRPARMPDGAPMDYAPDNEQGVVFLFCHLARKRFGLRIERIQAGYPDCVAYLGGKRIRIEFEYKSRNFVQHGHDSKKCDWLVCWIHDWPAAPKRLRVVELRKEYGLGFNVWFQPVSGGYAEAISTCSYDNRWSVPSQALEGDVLLFYRTLPDGFVRDVFRVAGPVGHVTARWKQGRDWMGPIRRICTLKSPVHFSDFKKHRVISSASFVRGKMRGRYRATEYWPDLYDMIVSRNPSAERFLKRFGPERLT